METKPEMLGQDGEREREREQGGNRQTDRARGQGNVVESPQGLLGKCSWMTALWNFTNGEF